MMLLSASARATGSILATMADLASHIDAMDMLEKLQIQNVHRASGGAELNYSCPFAGHLHGDEDPSAYMNAETTAWHCHGCKESGSNAVPFVAKVLNITFAQARAFLEEAYGVAFDEPDGGSMAAETERRFAPVPELPKLTPPDFKCVDDYAAALYSDAGTDAFEYARARGFMPDTLTDWCAGYDVLSRRLTIPVFDLDGELIGFKGRALDDHRKPKYLILGDRGKTARYGYQPYEASQVVFGLDRARDQDVIVLCEGELDVLALSQAGVPRPVSIGMSYLSDEHASLIVSEARHVVVFFDDDKAGKQGVDGSVAASGRRRPGIVAKLEPHIMVSVVDSHDGDPASMDPSDALALIDSAISTVVASTSHTTNVFG